MSADPLILDSIAGLLEAGHFTIDDLARHLAGRAEDAPAAETAPKGRRTLADLVADVEATLPENTKRTWRTHYQRLLSGVPPLCSCLCRQCLDTSTGCRCGCRECATSRLAIDPWGDRPLAEGMLSSLELERFATVAQRISQKRATAQNLGRAARGLAAKPAHGKGGRENAITALRHLLRYPVADGILARNPAEALTKPKRNEPKRRALSDKEIPEFLDAVAGGGGDPELDVMLCAFHMETGARRGGALHLQMGHLRWASQMIELTEKGAKIADQPVSMDLLVHLEAFAISRGGPVCDRRSPTYDLSRPVFYYRFPLRTPTGDLEPHSLTDRRYDTLYLRIQKTLPWANEIGLTSHCLRRTGATIIERIAGTQTARLFLRHGDRTVTDTYAASSMERLADAVSIYTGSPHPLSSSAD